MPEAGATGAAIQPGQWRKVESGASVRSAYLGALAGAVGSGMVGDIPELLEPDEPIGALLPIEGGGVLIPLLGALESVDGVVIGAGAGTTLVSSTFLLQAPRASNAVSAMVVAARGLIFDVNIGFLCEDKQALKAGRKGNAD
jgi:hypothetical protein